MGLEWCETANDPARRASYRASLDDEHRDLFDRIGSMDLDAEVWAAARSSLSYRWSAFMVDASEINGNVARIQTFISPLSIEVICSSSCFETVDRLLMTPSWHFLSRLASSQLSSPHCSRTVSLFMRVWLRRARTTTSWGTSWGTR